MDLPTNYSRRLLYENFVGANLKSNYFAKYVFVSHAAIKTQTFVEPLPRNHTTIEQSGPGDDSKSPNSSHHGVLFLSHQMCSKSW
jgi:hypothetical protein